MDSQDIRHYIGQLFEKILSSRTNVVLIVLAVLIIFFGSYAITGFVTVNTDDGDDKDIQDFGRITTFRDTGADICLEDGKPVIRLFSTTRCPHCTWVKDTFDSVAKEYADKGLIVAYHWELDTGDNTITPEIEGEVPDSEVGIFRSFAGGYVPAYSMGCKYVRVGNGHENEGLGAEEAEFRAVIEMLIESTFE
jgi:thiol-disulfide isomerase/thioredoxin